MIRVDARPSLFGFGALNRLPEELKSLEFKRVLVVTDAQVAKSGIITDYSITNASVHDSQELEHLINELDGGLPLYADSAYVGREEKLSELKIRNCIHEKGYRNHPLTEIQKSNNKKRSGIRVRVEHVFGFMQNSMRGKWIKTIGMTRAEVLLGLNNLTYNICRFRYLCGARCAQTV